MLTVQVPRAGGQERGQDRTGKGSGPKRAQDPFLMLTVQVPGAGCAGAVWRHSGILRPSMAFDGDSSLPSPWALTASCTALGLSVYAQVALIRANIPAIARGINFLTVTILGVAKVARPGMV
jgi:hypothetical protein